MFGELTVPEFDLMVVTISLALGEYVPLLGGCGFIFRRLDYVYFIQKDIHLELS